MTEAGVTTNYTYNGLNQLVSKIDNSGTTTYNYDANGNQIEEISPNSTLTFDYLVTGELEEVKSAGQTLQKNTYNHEGIRVAKQEDSKTRTYYYDQGSVAFALDKGTAQTASTLSTANLRALDGEVIGSYRGEDYYIYTEDIQGSTGKILDDSLSTKNTYSYTDFGEVEVSTSETNGNTISLVANEICYTGAIYDETTGLHYLNARYYDPENGRFISQDTYRGDKNEISQWHLYAYCANNPINYTDPSGHARTIKKSPVAWAIDIAASVFAPGAKWAYDIIGETIEYIYKKKGLRKVSSVLIYDAVPKITGLYGKYYTKIRTAIYRATGYTIKYGAPSIVAKNLNNLANALTKWKIETVTSAVIDCFSLGGAISVALDMFTDKNLNNKIIVY